MCFIFADGVRDQELDVFGHIPEFFPALEREFTRGVRDLILDVFDYSVEGSFEAEAPIENVFREVVILDDVVFAKVVNDFAFEFEFSEEDEQDLI